MVERQGDGEETVSIKEFDIAEVKKIPRATKAVRKAARRIISEAASAAEIPTALLTPKQAEALEKFRIYKRLLGVEARERVETDRRGNAGTVYALYPNLGERGVNRILNHFIQELANAKNSTYIDLFTKRGLEDAHYRIAHGHKKHHGKAHK